MPRCDVTSGVRIDCCTHARAPLGKLLLLNESGEGALVSQRPSTVKPAHEENNRCENKDKLHDSEDGVGPTSAARLDTELVTVATAASDSRNGVTAEMETALRSQTVPTLLTRSLPGRSCRRSQSRNSRQGESSMQTQKDIERADEVCHSIQ